MARRFPPDSISASRGLVDNYAFLSKRGDFVSRDEKDSQLNTIAEHSARMFCSHPSMEAVVLRTYVQSEVYIFFSFFFAFTRVGIRTCPYRYAALERRSYGAQHLSKRHMDHQPSQTNVEQGYRNGNQLAYEGGTETNRILHCIPNLTSLNAPQKRGQKHD